MMNQERRTNNFKLS